MADVSAILWTIDVTLKAITLSLKKTADLLSLSSLIIGMINLIISGFFSKDTTLTGMICGSACAFLSAVMYAAELQKYREAA